MSDSDLYPQTIVWESKRRWGGKKKHYTVVNHVFELKVVIDKIKELKAKFIRTERKQP